MTSRKLEAPKARMKREIKAQFKDGKMADLSTRLDPDRQGTDCSVFSSPYLGAFSGASQGLI